MINIKETDNVRCVYIYTQENIDTVYAEIFAEQEANRIFTIIFLRITGSSWKGSMLCTVTNLQLLQTSKFSRIKILLYLGDREIREVYISWKFPRIRYLLFKLNLFYKLELVKNIQIFLLN